MEISINSGVVDLKQRKYFRIQNKYSRGNFKSDASNDLNDISFCSFRIALILILAVIKYN